VIYEATNDAWHTFTTNLFNTCHFKLDAIGEASCLNDIAAKDKVPWYKQFEVKNNITNKEYEKWNLICKT